MSFTIECNQAEAYKRAKGLLSVGNGFYLPDAELFTDTLPMGTNLDGFRPHSLSDKIRRKVIDVKIQAQQTCLTITSDSSTSDKKPSFTIAHDFFAREGLPVVVRLGGMDFQCILRPPQLKDKSKYLSHETRGFAW